jgi:Aerotolerance regulator N-terminal
LRRFKKEYFTNVRFLKELSIQTRKSSQLKKWLLLLTRLLLLLFLILAFAQPFFQAKDHKSAANELVIVLDNSFSMQAKGQKGELLKRTVQELLENTPETQNFMLITNSETYHNTDIKSIQKELQNLKYSATSFQLDQVLTKIKSKKTRFNRDLVIITDAVNLKSNQLKIIDSTMNAYFIVPKAEQKNNASVDSVYINQRMDNFYEITINLSAYGSFEEEIPVALYNNKNLIAKTQVKFDTNKKSINLTIPNDQFNGYVSIEDNRLSYDNFYYFSILKPKKTNVLSIGEATKSNFLSKIYSVAEFNFTNSELKTLDYNSIDQQDAIVLNELEDIPNALQTTLKSFIEKGGQVILIPSTSGNVVSYNTFLNQIGTIQLGTFENTVKNVTAISFTHPLYQGVFEKKIDNFQYPNTKSNFILKSTSPSILTYEDQNPFLTSISNDLGTVYVFATAVNKENSNFQNSPLIVPTFYNMAQSNFKTGVIALPVGKNSIFVVEAELNKDDILTIRNEESSFIPSQQLLNNKVKITFGEMPTVAGNYTILKKEEPLQTISFNYDRTESNVNEENSALLEDFEQLDSVETVFEKLQTERTDQQIWKWFVWFTLLFLILELLIQKFVK